MKNKIKLFRIVTIVTIISFGLSACDENQPDAPSAPFGVVWKDDVLTWGAVAGADGYDVFIDSNLYRAAIKETRLNVPLAFLKGLKEDYSSLAIVVQAFAGNARSPSSNPAIIISSEAQQPNHEIMTLERAPFTKTISADIDIISFVGVSGYSYTESSIVVARRSTPLTIELENVNATGRHGGNGATGVNGSNGAPVIRVDGNGTVPDIIILSQGTQNRLTGGNGGEGGGGTRGERGRRGGNGATAVIGADRLTVMGGARLVIGGGNGGKGGQGGGSSSLTNRGNPGGHGGNAGVAVTANNFIVNMNPEGVTAIHVANGGGGGSAWGVGSSVGNVGSNDTSKFVNMSGSVIVPQVLGGRLE